MSRPIHNCPTIIVAMSGGVDSSVAALLLLRHGWRVIGATMDTGHGQAPEQAAAVCARLGIEHRVVEIRESFDRLVVQGFVEAYLSGLTPNPCVDCNADVKFPAFLPLLQESGAAYFATGHYARIARLGGRYVLRQAVDREKDQSYFLYRLGQDLLSRCLFPLGELTKGEVRKLAAQAGLPSAEQKDSYDVCFINSGDYRELLRERAAERLQAGDIVDQSGRLLGRHQGLANYTLGQRRGLNVSLGYPAYVVELDRLHNRLVVGERERLCRSEALLGQVNSLFADRPEGTVRGQVKIRYQSPPAWAEIAPAADAPGLLRLSFDEPVWGMTPGQSAVCYQDDLLALGGKILRVL